MKDSINIEVVIDSMFKEPKVKIYTDKRTEEVEQILGAIENAHKSVYPPVLGLRDDVVVPVFQRDIIKAIVDNRNTRIYSSEGEFIVKKKLSELEETLNPDRFVRISQSEIINLRKVKGFDFSVLGTIGIEYDDGSRSWVSRRFVKALRNTLTGFGIAEKGGRS
ncbi:MAG: LytTR family transcriptional regulator [Lachnospiraceae bacterium]|nr:LytTR family transcriptional regulator [Lachnospiraceae bacterium]